jgi:hypothetical protein
MEFKGFALDCDLVQDVPYMFGFSPTPGVDHETPGFNPKKSHQDQLMTND